MTYELIRQIAGIGGMLIFMALFAGVLIYVFWPGNKKRFERASRIPLDRDPDDSELRGENGR
ncbi:MAG: cbb3-type cytochrome c oxidase subunit 3 [Rhodomicrobium sp.]|nr:cbb3-type cytochrome c oxidase subunit 3 [Rhodomicrobium sp.]